MLIEYEKMKIHKISAPHSLLILSIFSNERVCIVGKLSSIIVRHLAI